MPRSVGVYRVDQKYRFLAGQVDDDRVLDPCGSIAISFDRSDPG